MKGLVLTQHGMEALCAKEISTLVKAKVEQRKGCLLVEVKTLEDLAIITYRAQSIWKVLILLIDEPSIEKAKEALPNSKLKDYINDKVDFCCRAFVDGGYESTQTLQAEIGGLINDITDAKVKLKNPQVQAFVIEQPELCYIGIDLAGIDLSKREYRVFASFEQLKATSAFAALLFADYDKNKILVDPFCRSGMLCIEAALKATNTSHNFYTKDKLAFTKLKGDWDKFFNKQDDLQDKPELPITAADDQNRHISAAKKNAKIAGVQKLLTFSRMNTDWLEVRLGENSTDLIVTMPPQLSKIFNEKKVKALYEELFYQADYILKKKGTMNLIMKDLTLILPAAELKGFKELERLQVSQGQESFYLLKFGR